MPFGQLPVLEFDGKRLYQSQAICQYLGRKYDLVTGDVWEDAELVALAGALQDFVISINCFQINQKEFHFLFIIFQNRNRILLL